MIKFDKKDIIILDFIIEKSIEKHPEPVFLTDLINNGFSNEITEFERLMSIILKYECADCRFIPSHINDQKSSVTKNIRTLQFKKQGGFKKAYNEFRKPLDWYRIIPIILSVIFGSSTIYFSKKSFDLKENQSDIIIKYDSLKVQNAFLIKLVDSLKVEHKSQLDKLRK